MARVWFITGSSRGLGFAITEAALKAGDKVIATARNASVLVCFQKEFGDNIYPISLDVTNKDQVSKAVAEGHKKFGRLDVVVNNAGYANTVGVEDIEIEDFENQVNTNFLGVVYVTKAVLPILREQASGYIFQVSSLGDRLGAPGLSAYQSVKWAVSGFSTVLSQEIAPFGIKLTVLEPGGIKTDWAGSSMKVPPVSEPYKQTVGAFAEFLKSSDGGPSRPEKIAEIIFKLLNEKESPLRLLIGSDAASYGAQVAKELAERDAKWNYLTLQSS
ncbi:hypothetical protein DASC09_021360 [Saccharomycopsis crataegensis]|uniref:Uncharacterized protein n=1 Tax=Saccharomycopsis crataegensis TaxID=43959 RepID=A0AAV5QJE9_9ASCO|nr:hypothetical protein DASC09_021360 [Saccharomycopsis crataegensis]